MFVKDDICVSYYTMRRGVVSGGGIMIYRPPISNVLLTCETLTRFEIAMTGYSVYPPKSNSWLRQWLGADQKLQLSTIYNTVVCIFIIMQQQELSYRQQIARQLRTRDTIRLKCELEVTEGHWK